MRNIGRALIVFCESLHQGVQAWSLANSDVHSETSEHFGASRCTGRGDGDDRGRIVEVYESRAAEAVDAFRQPTCVSLEILCDRLTE